MLATERQCSTPAEFAAEPAAALLDDLSDYARHCTTRVEFRRLTVERLRGCVGFDGVAWGPIPAGAPGTPLEYYEEHVPAELISSLARRADARAEVTRALRTLEARGVAVDGGYTADEKRRSIFFSEFLAPAGIRTYVSVLLRTGNASPTAMRLTRDRTPFGADAIGLLCRLRSLLQLCEALFDARASVEIDLTARQRAIVDYVAAGLTNREIAGILGISPNTVRNRLAEAFARLEVASRAELVAMVLRR